MDDGVRSTRRSRFFGLGLIVAVSMGINAIGVLSIDPLASVMIETDVLQAIDAVSSRGIARVLNVVLPFALFGLLLAAYLFPIAAAFADDRRSAQIPEQVARRILGIPTTIAALTGGTWLFALPVVVIGWRILGFDLEDRFYIEYLNHSMVLFGFSFVLSYYGVEVVTQRYVVPRVFSGSAALKTGSRIALPLGARIHVLAGASFFLPSLVMATTIRILNNDGANRFGRDLLPKLNLTLAALGALVVLIAMLKGLSIAAPIVELTDAARRLGSGDFEARVTVRSVDRIGELGGAFNEMAAGLAERERERSIFGRVVDPRVRDRLLAADNLNNGELRIATIVFFDLAGFTSISERLPPRAVVAILNEYFQIVSSCVEAQGGLVNKFIGDGVLAVFGAPEDQPDHAARALRAIGAVGPLIASLNRQLLDEGHKPIRVRVGAHTGELMAGVVGSRTRQEYTVIGDAVNTASRLESMAKERGVDAVISESCWSAAGKDDAWTPLGQTSIRGKTEALHVLGRTISQQ